MTSAGRRQVSLGTALSAGLEANGCAEPLGGTKCADPAAKLGRHRGMPKAGKSSMRVASTNGMERTWVRSSHSTAARSSMCEKRCLLAETSSWQLTMKTRPGEPGVAKLHPAKAGSRQVALVERRVDDPAPGQVGHLGLGSDRQEARQVHAGEVSWLSPSPASRRRLARHPLRSRQVERSRVLRAPRVPDSGPPQDEVFVIGRPPSGPHHGTRRRRAALRRHRSSADDRVASMTAFLHPPFSPLLTRTTRDREKISGRQ